LCPRRQLTAAAAPSFTPLSPQKFPTVFPQPQHPPFEFPHAFPRGSDFDKFVWHRGFALICFAFLLTFLFSCVYFISIADFSDY